MTARTGADAASLTYHLRRFWDRVDRSGDCWLWTGETNNQGYGRLPLWQGERRTRVFAHRLSLLIHGRELPDGQIVMHSCGNPPCVNPDHLVVGTQTDNMRDCLAKGRMDMSGLPLGWHRHRKDGAA